jgi:hypothetical protein
VFQVQIFAQRLVFFNEGFGGLKKNISGTSINSRQMLKLFHVDERTWNTLRVLPYQTATTGHRQKLGQQ